MVLQNEQTQKWSENLNCNITGRITDAFKYGLEKAKFWMKMKTIS